MPTVTERAKEELRRVLVTSGAGPDEGLRLYPRINNSYLLSIGAELSGDQVVEHVGLKVLLIGIEYFNMLDGAVIDCRETEHGPVLFVRIDSVRDYRTRMTRIKSNPQVCSEDRRNISCLRLK